MLNRRLRTILVATAFLLGLLTAGTAAAEDVSVDISTIYASESGDGVDEKLTKLEDELVAGFKGYDTFELIGQKSLDLKKDKAGTVPLPDQDESTLEMTYRGRTTDKKLLRLDVGLAGKISAEVKASPGSTFFQAGLLYKDGILILAIKADLRE